MTLLLTQREAASVLRLSTRTIERLRVSGLGPKFIRTGSRSIRYRQSDLEEWIAGRVVRSTSQAVGAVQLTEVISYDYKVSLVKN
jgi:excisionase family DNA binding protein